MKYAIVDFKYISLPGTASLYKSGRVRFSSFADANKKAKALNEEFKEKGRFGAIELNLKGV